MCCDSKFWPCCKCHFFCRGRPAEQGQALACFLHEIFLTNFSWNFPDKNKKILKFWGGHGPPGPPTNEATGTEQGQALPSSTEQGQALASAWNFPNKLFHEIFLTKIPGRTKRCHFRTLIASQNVILCPGWNHETAIGWRSKNISKF